MDKRITACLYFGSASLLIGLLSFSRWGVLSLLGFCPADLCTPKVARRFFSQRGSINQTIANKIKKDFTVLNYAFVNAVKQDNLSSLQHLIDSGADVNMKDELGFTPLFFAKSEKAAQLLIDSGAEVKAKSNEDVTPLFFAQSREIAQLLVDNGADINARDVREHTPLFNQVNDNIFRPYLYYKDYEFNNFVNDIEVVKFLIENGADINAKNWSGRTPLFFARRKKVAQLLIDSGAIVDIKSEDTNSLLDRGNTPLFSANTKEIAQLLIDSGINIDAKNNQGETALASVASDTDIDNGLASQASRKEIVKTLIENGADVDARDNYNRTPLHQLVFKIAVSQSASNFSAIDEEIVEILIKNGADANAKNNGGRNILFDVAHPKIAQILIDNGADVNHIVSNRDEMRQTILYENIYWKKNVEMAQVLIRNGADVSPKDSQGRNFLFIIEHPEIAKLLIENGADVTLKDNSGKTPLFYVDDIEVARELIKSGADLNAKNNDGKTPLIAVESSLKSAQKRLKEHNSFSGNTFYKTELIANSKQRIKKIEELIEFLVKSGGVK